jgi:hypothetical protein
MSSGYYMTITWLLQTIADYYMPIFLPFDRLHNLPGSAR